MENHYPLPFLIWNDSAHILSIPSHCLQSGRLDGNRIFSAVLSWPTNLDRMQYGLRLNSFPDWQFIVVARRQALKCHQLPKAETLAIFQHVLSSVILTISRIAFTRNPWNIYHLSLLEQHRVCHRNLSGLADWPHFWHSQPFVAGNQQYRSLEPLTVTWCQLADEM